MIKIISDEIKEVVTVKPFPKLMISSSGRIVLFHSLKLNGDKSNTDKYGCGIDLSGNCTSINGWAMDNFTDYNEPITIQNI